MSVNGLQTELASASVPKAGGHAIPEELLLAIVDITLAESRNGNSTAARRFSCVSRALRAYTIPIIYEVLIIDSPGVPRLALGQDTPRPTPIVGHDGRNYANSKLAYLAWLIRDPTAEPRKYVKYLGFQHQGKFSTDDIGHVCRWNGSDDELVEILPAGYLDIDLLIVKNPSHVLDLQHVGVRARQIHLLLMSPFVINLFDNAPFTNMMNSTYNRLVYNDNTRGQLRCWTREQASYQEIAHMKNQNDFPKSEPSSLVGMVHRQLDQVDNTPHPGGEFFMIEAHNNYAMENADVFVDDIANILRRDQRQHVVLVHALDDQTDADKVAKAVASARKKLPQDLRKQLRVSHASFDPAVLRGGHMRACFDLARRGIDPWDVGHVPASLLSE